MSKNCTEKRNIIMQNYYITMIKYDLTLLSALHFSIAKINLQVLSLSFSFRFRYISSRSCHFKLRLKTKKSVIIPNFYSKKIK